MAKQPTSELQELYDAMVAKKQVLDDALAAHDKIVERAGKIFRRGPSVDEGLADYAAVESAMDDHETAKSAYEAALSAWERDNPE